MKRRFLVNYDYGMGGAWALVLAESTEDLVSRFPELTVVTEHPGSPLHGYGRSVADTVPSSSMQ